MATYNPELHRRSQAEDLRFGIKVEDLAEAASDWADEEGAPQQLVHALYRCSVAISERLEAMICKLDELAN